MEKEKVKQMDDLISRQAAIDIERNATVDTNPSHFEAHQKFTQFIDDAEVSSFGRWQWSNGFNTALTAVGIDLKKLPSAHPDVPEMNDGDMISRQVAQHKINALIDEFETIMKDIRERHVDDSVCGLCEYDGAFITDSGNWCNECPGFERDDCFKLKDQYREEWAGAIKNLQPVQTEIIHCNDCLYKKNCSWKNQGAKFCSFGERGKQDDNPRTDKHFD